MPEEKLAKALARADGQPDTAFQALGQLADDLIGVRLFTLMTFDAERNLARRFYSNMPDAYPVMGTKEVVENTWTKAVLEGRRTFVANTIEDIAQVFPDFELIDSLGCQAVINIPIIVGGAVLGTINCLDVEGHYTPDRAAASEALKLPGAACFLFHAKLSDQGDS